MGIIYAVISAILLATTNLLQKWVTNQGIVYSQHIFTAISSVFFAGFYVFLKDKNFKQVLSMSKKSKLFSTLGGCAFYFASFFQALAYQYLPGSIVTIIVQLALEKNFFGYCRYCFIYHHFAITIKSKRESKA